MVLVALLLAVSTSEGDSDPREVVRASEIMAKIKRWEPVEYDSVIVEGDLDLRLSHLPTEYVERNDFEINGLGLTEDVKSVRSQVSITSSEIHGNVSFGDAIFREQVNFKKTNFTGEAVFSGSIFSGDAEFSGAEFSGGDADFSGAEFSGGDANFWGAKFSGTDADFGGALFSGGDARFLGAVFSGGDADFGGAAFSGGDADFHGAEYSGGYANFWGAKFSGGDSYFSEAKFSGGDASFWGAEFSGGHADFGEAEFSGGDANFRAAIFSGGYANFEESEFSGGDANFHGAVYSGGDAFFGWAAFSGGDADFSWAKFNRYAYFINTTYGGTDQSESYDVSLEYVRFDRDAHFENATIHPNTRLDLTGSSYRRLFFPWSSIGQNLASSSDDDSRLALMKNYMNLGWHEDANSCYYEFRNKRRADEPNRIEKVIDTVEWALYGYGVRPYRTAGWIVGLILAFGLIFRRGGSIKKYVVEKRKEVIEEGSTEERELVEREKKGKTRSFELKAPLREEEIDFKDPFLFSLTTFTSGLTSFLYPSIKFEATEHTRLVIFERLLGFFFLALLIAAINKTWLVR